MHMSHKYRQEVLLKWQSSDIWEKLLTNQNLLNEGFRTD